MTIGDEVLHVKKHNDLASQPPGQDWNVTSYMINILKKF